MLTLSLEQALDWGTRLIAIAVILQTLELLTIRRMMSDSGIWIWAVLKRDFEFLRQPAQKTLQFLLSYPNFIGVLLLQLTVGVVLLLLPNPWCLALLLLTSFLVTLRWRGSFNGGSDSMTIILLTALCVANFYRYSPKVAEGCLWYISIQTVLSYFVAGLVKLKGASWHTGEALRGYLSFSNYDVPAALKALAAQRAVVFLAAWLIMLFECSFPIALADSNTCLIYLALALGFHCANVYVFGLNRFLFAWGAAYPALYYCSQRRH